MAYLNPSKRITEVLSEYLEFDPASLEIGLWSGDFSLEQVSIKAEAVYPLLNPDALSKGTDRLCPTLKKGTIGSLHIKIPWKRLVWGQGDVQVSVENVQLELEFESPQETAKRKRRQFKKQPSSQMEMDDGSEDGLPDDRAQAQAEKAAARDRKQELLRQAEQLQLQGLPIPMAALESDNQNIENLDAAEDVVPWKKDPGRLEGWVRSFMSSFTWRFFAGLQASIRQLRVVLVQEGIEMGCLLHSLEITPSGSAVNTTATTKDSSSSSPGSDDPSRAESQSMDFIVVGDRDDGEHVEKEITLSGLGFFIRETTTDGKVPESLRFSSSVTADDYVLRPTDININFTFFYPHPAHKRKQKKALASVESPAETATEEPQHSAASVVTTDSSKVRRGKRDKMPAKIVTETVVTDETSDTFSGVPVQQNLRTTSSLEVQADDSDSMSSTRARAMTSDSQFTEQARNNAFRAPEKSKGGIMRSISEANSTAAISQGSRGRADLRIHLQHMRVNPLSGSQRSLTTASQQNTSTAVSVTSLGLGHAMRKDHRFLSPHCDLSFEIGEVKTLCGSSHYDLAHLFAASLMRLRNGRPPRTILSILSEDGGADFTREVTIDLDDMRTPLRTEVEASAGIPVIDEHETNPILPPITPKKHLDTNFLPPPIPGRSGGARRSQTEGAATGQAPTERQKTLHLALNLPVVRSERSGVVREWWKYAGQNVLREVRQRKKNREFFVNHYIRFDWDLQSHRRKEYVDLYISHRLDQSSPILHSLEMRALPVFRHAEETMLEIEDELPVEQILLYRSIARALRVRGMNAMPTSLRFLRTGMSEERHRRLTEPKGATFNLPFSGGITKGGLSVEAFLPSAVIEMREQFALARRRFSTRDQDSNKDTGADASSDFGSIAGDKSGLPKNSTNAARKSISFNDLVSPANETNKAVTESGSRRQTVVSQADARTIRSFKTARTSESKPKTDSEGDLTRLKFSFSAHLGKLEFLLYEDKEYLKRAGKLGEVGSDSSVRDFGAPVERLGQTVKELVATNENGSDSISEISFQSQDIDEELVDEHEEEEELIMSATDFLFFGNPTGVVLHVNVVGARFAYFGLSGGQKEQSCSIRSLCVNGVRGCHLFSSGAREDTSPSNAFGNPLKEVDIGSNSGCRRRRSTIQYVEQPLHAISMVAVTTPEASIVDVDFAKVSATVELEAVVPLKDFMGASTAILPSPILENSKRDLTRQQMLREERRVRERSTMMGKEASYALRLHGVEIFLPIQPIPVERPLEARVDLSNPELDVRPRLKLELDLLAYYDGVRAEELCPGLSEVRETATHFSDARGAFSVDTEPALPLHLVGRLQMLDVEGVLEELHHGFYDHAVLMLSSLQGYTESPAKSQSVFREGRRLLERPLNLEMLISTNNDEAVDGNARYHVSSAASDLSVWLSKSRLQDVTQYVDMSSSILKDKTVDAGQVPAHSRYDDTQFRLAFLAKRTSFAASFAITTLKVGVLDETSNFRRELTFVEKEVILEESVADYLSILSCFDMNFPFHAAIDLAEAVCVDRIMAIGFSREEAMACTTTARRNFLDDIRLVQRTQTEIIQELSNTVSAADGGGRESKTPDVQESDVGIQDEVGEDEDNSVESLEILETALNDAVEKTLAEMASTIDVAFNEPIENREFVTLRLPQGCHLNATKFFYDLHLDAAVPELAVADRNGIHLARIAPALSEGSVDVGLRFVSFEVDKGYDLGSGGLPLTALGESDIDDDLLPREQRERLTSISLGRVEVTFARNVVENLVTALGSLKGTPRNSKTTTTGSSIPVEVHFGVESSQVALHLLSDELFPFASLSLSPLKGGNIVPLRTEREPSMEQPGFKLHARTIRLTNLAPESQIYPLCIVSLEKGLSEDVDDSFTLTYLQSTNPWKESDFLDIRCNATRVILLRQFINELVQFFVSESYGVGYLLTKYQSDPVLDVNGKPPKPFLFQVKVQDSTVVIPVSSAGLDMAAVEVEEIVVMNKFVDRSFEMPSPIQLLKKGSIVKSKSFRTSSSTEAEFFDCRYLEEADSGQLSGVDHDALRRISVEVRNGRIFTSLSSVKSGSSPGMGGPFLRDALLFNGRAEPFKSVYVQNEAPGESFHNLSGELVSKALCRYWEEITMAPISLEVLCDYAPHLRLLITDRVDGEVVRTGISLDTRLSQFCALLSIWYNNMQELPTIFPYDLAAIETGSRSLKPPSSFPDYGTEAFIDWLKKPAAFRSEICLDLSLVRLLCSFDAPDHFESKPASLALLGKVHAKGRTRKSARSSHVLDMQLKYAVVHVTSDSHGIMRIAAASNGLRLVDERRNPNFKTVFNVCSLSESTHSWPDLQFGLDLDAGSLREEIPQPFQVSTYLTPGWSLTNLGINKACATMFDFTPIWILLDYFSSYFSSGAFGHPYFEAETNLTQFKDKLMMTQGNLSACKKRSSGLNIDFRLWLTRPVLTIPSSTLKTSQPSVIASCRTGLWYRYTAIDTFSSQEVASTNISLGVAKKFVEPSHHQESDRSRTVRNIVEGMSFGLRMDFNTRTNHQDIVVQIPLVDGTADASKVCSIASTELDLPSIVLPPPTVCTPEERYGRKLGASVCEITVLIEAIPMVIEVLTIFLTGSVEEPLSESGASTTPQAMSQSQMVSDPSCVVKAQVGGIRVFAIDPVLEKHLPIAVASISSVCAAFSQLSNPSRNLVVPNHEAPPGDFQLTLDVQLWVDYFKLGATRSWEPLVEPVRCFLLYEKSERRGQGFTVNSNSPIQMNVTGALLLILDEAVTSFSRSIKETFFADDQARYESLIRSTRRKAFEEVAGTSVDQTLSRHDIEVKHSVPKALSPSDRVAFSFRNLTGQRIRLHQATPSYLVQTTDVASVTYLDQASSTSLEFEATVSVLCNMGVVEVPFPGLPRADREDNQRTTVNHAIAVQVPGFKWVQGMTADTSGRKFYSLLPRSPEVLHKVDNDWRLANAVKILTEVGLENGGRLITVRSLFEIRNNTSHHIKLEFHPDPRHTPSMPADDDGGHAKVPWQLMSSEGELEPSESFQIPVLLLESALQLHGSHLGCVWIRPGGKDGNTDLFQSLHLGDKAAAGPSVDFSSRPIQLAKVVHESSQIFRSNRGEDIPPDEACTGIQISCPISEGNQLVPLAPFCYAVEVRRSPLVGLANTQGQQHDRPRVNFALGKEKGQRELGAELNGPRPMRGRRRDGQVRQKPLRHAPVTYSLVIHPPLILENLLPVGGRFELMHASRRTVLWFADLKPGERLPIHTVGLDGPLLLLVNLGFCRTPVGEGALVHHGAEPKGTAGQVGGFKSIGKAVTKGTKQIGKTLTTLSDSPDKRGKGIVSVVQNPQLYRSKRNTRNVANVTANPGSPLGLDHGDDEVKGKVHVVDSKVYSQDDIATETVVVDSVGQRLTLSIENVRGGAGQRRVSLFCPFWIINTTEHSLRYKQEGSAAYVSGTVASPDVDGTKPVDSSSTSNKRRGRLTVRSATSQRRMMEPRWSLRRPRTVFAGTPGALATHGQSQLTAKEMATLLEKELKIDTLAAYAFMYNFHDGVLSIGHHKLCVQMADGAGFSDYSTDWSPGFSLDSVGVPQVIGMHCKDGRSLELSVAVSVAPGFLSGYTKIVRFTPRFVLVNKLEQPIRLWQDSSLLHSLYDDRAAQESASRNSRTGKKWKVKSENGNDVDKISQYEVLFGRTAILDSNEVVSMQPGTTAHRSALYITTVGSDDLTPFHLPDTRGDRQLRIDVGGSWNLTASFNADVAGEHTLKMTKAVDLRLLSHVNTRASPHYKVVLPPEDPNLAAEWEGELGVWFETDWGGNRKIIVKGTRRSRFAFNHTDIHVGDELLRIDDVNVSQLTFAETMKLLKERLAFVSLAQKAPTSNPRRSSIVSKRGLFTGRASTSNGAFGANQEPATVTLTFRTLEEKLRRLRANAARARRFTTLGRGRSTPQDESVRESLGNRMQPIESDHSEMPHSLKVEMRTIYNSLFVVVKEQDMESPPYRIENRAINHVLLFRQRGSNGHPWNVLNPGDTIAYSWEEPMKARKLTVRIGSIDVGSIADGDSTDSDEHDLASLIDDGIEAVENKARERRARLKQALSIQYVESEDQSGLGAARTVKLEEIGFHDELPCPTMENEEKRRSLFCHVDTDGATRVLIVSDARSSQDERTVLSNHVSIIGRRIEEEEVRRSKLRELQRVLCGECSNVEEEKEEIGSEIMEIPFQTREKRTRDSSSQIDPLERAVEAEALRLADFPEGNAITSTDQIIIQVIEAAGLKSNDVTGNCNPYCEVTLKGPAQSKGTFRSRGSTKRKTYYVERSMAPKWSNQCFVFDVPATAPIVTRGHSLRISLRNFRFVGRHSYLGQTTVHLRNLRAQKEMVGWYPLVGRAGRRELEDSQVNWGRGSVRLRVQWVYTVLGLVDYFLLLSENRLSEFKESHRGMQVQLAKVVELEKHRRSAQDRMLQGRIPNILGLKALPKQRLQSGNPTEDATEMGRMTARMVQNIKSPLQISRDKLLWLLYFQAAENRRSRRLRSQGQIGRRSTIDRLSSIAEADSGFPDLGESLPVDRPDHDESATRLHDAEISGVTQRLIDGNGRRRSVSWSEFELRRNVSQNLVDFRRRVQTFSRGNIESEVSDDAGPIFLEHRLESDPLITTSSVDDLKRDETVDSLVHRGHLFRLGDSRFHKQHLSFKFRNTLLLEESRAGLYVPKSLQTLSHTPPFIRSWIMAQALLNDPGLKVHLRPSGLEATFVACEEDDEVPSFTGDEESTESFRELYLEKYKLPPQSPVAMADRAKLRAAASFDSRNNFERACKRSLRSVFNPGGWLTIRPITVLNLTDNFSGMFIRLRYGAEGIVTQTVDSRVVPRWGDEASSIHTDSTGKFIFDDNDLQVYVEPQKTSGSLRLAVVGERLNAKQELGVLHVPLGSAISCCVEAMETATEGEMRGDSVYTRWFPLMSPSDAVPVDGDMGNTLRPTESEQERDNQFSNYFTPCVKLAMIWQPNPDGRRSNVAFPSQTEADPDLAALADDDMRKEDQPLTTLYFNADFNLMSAALIDSQRAIELLSISVSDVDVRYSVTRSKTRIGVVVGWIQMDQQGEYAREPVVLAPSPAQHHDPTLQFLAVKDNLRSKGDVDSYDYIGISLQEIDIIIEEGWMFDFWEFLVSVSRRREVKSKLIRSSVGRGHRDMRSNQTSTQFVPVSGSDADTSLYNLLFGDESTILEQKVYVEQLLLGSVKMNLSYVKGKRSNWELTEGGGFVLKGADGVVSIPDLTISAGGLRVKKHFQGSGHSEVFSRWSEHTHDDDRWSDTGGAKSSKNLPQIVAAVFPSVSDAPVRLQGKEISHVFESPTEIFNSIRIYYVNETLRQIYKIVGSLDFVGNPTMVLHSFATGVRDFFVTPSQEFLRAPSNPSRVGLGVAKGTLSLVSHSASGIFGFISKMSASAGQAAAYLSFDEEYKRWHREMILSEAKNLDRHWRQRGLQSVPIMLSRPIYDILRGGVLGATGLFVSPYRGAKKNGGIGLMKGVAVGVVGVAAKPVVGVLDAFTHFAGSVHDVAKSVNVLEKRYQPAKRLRHPYFFGPKSILLPFDIVAARSVHLLRSFPMKSRRAAESWMQKTGLWEEIHVCSEVLHMEPGVETFAIVTTHRVVLIKATKDNTGNVVPNMSWEVYLCWGRKVSCKVQDKGHNGVALTIATRWNRSSENENEYMTQATPAGGGADDLEPTTPKPAGLQDTSASSGLTEQLELSVDINVSRDPTTDIDTTAPSIGPTPSEMEIQLASPLIQTHDLVDQGLGARQGNKGDTLEWFTVLAEFQHLRQLFRIHNAICCLVGDFDSVIQSGLALDFGKEGYTVFGDLQFTKDSTEVDRRSQVEKEQAILRGLEYAPWVHESIFMEYRFVGGKETKKRFAETRLAWSMAKEMQVSREKGGPEWLVLARAQAMFVPKEPPPLPQGQLARSPAVLNLLLQLERGILSYEDVQERLGDIRARHEATMLEALRDSSREIDDEDMFSVGASPRIQRIGDYDALLESDRSEDGSFNSTSFSKFKSTRSLFDTSPEATLGSSGRHRQLQRNVWSERPLTSMVASGDAEASPIVNSNQSSETSRDSSTTEAFMSARLALSSDSGSRRELRGSGALSSDSGSRRELGGSGAPSRRTVDMTSPADTGRLDRVEVILEKLLEVTLFQAQEQQQLQERRQHRVRGRLEPVDEELDDETEKLRVEAEMLRAQVAAKKKKEEKADSLKREIAKLRRELSSMERKSSKRAYSPAPRRRRRKEEKMEATTPLTLEEVKGSEQSAGGSPKDPNTDNKTPAVTGGATDESKKAPTNRTVRTEKLNDDLGKSSTTTMTSSPSGPALSSENSARRRLRGGRRLRGLRSRKGPDLDMSVSSSESIESGTREKLAKDVLSSELAGSGDEAPAEVTPDHMATHTEI